MSLGQRRRPSPAFAMAAVFAVAGCSGAYGGRDGRAEALRDVANDRPITLYTHAMNGAVVGYDTPSVPGCNPTSIRSSEQRSIHFIEQPELAFQEGEPVPWWSFLTRGPKARAAGEFARAYNGVMVEKHRVSIERICPAFVRYSRRR